MGISDGLGHPYVKGSVFRLLPRWAGIGRGDRDCVLDEALAFYGRLFRFELRGKSDSMAFIDLGDQFIALQKGRRQPADDGRHFGLVVDDKEAARKALEAAGVTFDRCRNPYPRARALLPIRHCGYRWRLRWLIRMAQ